MDTIRRIAELTTPAEEPIDLASLKAHLRVSNTSDDAWLTAAIKAARFACEDYTGCAFIRRTFRMFMDQPIGHLDRSFRGPRDDWWDGVREVPVSILTSAKIEILKRPLVSVQSVTAYDDADVATVVDSLNYVVDASDQSQPGRLILRRGQVWPVVLRVANGFQVDFTAGFGATAADLPADLVLAVKMVASYMYANRGDCSCDSAGAKSSISPAGAAALLDSFRLVRF